MNDRFAPVSEGRVSVNAERIRHLCRLADNDSEHEGSLAEYLADNALDIADALDRVSRVDAALEGLSRHSQHVSRNFPAPGICASCRRAWPCDVERFRAALATPSPGAAPS